VLCYYAVINCLRSIYEKKAYASVLFGILMVNHAAVWMWWNYYNCQILTNSLTYLVVPRLYCIRRVGQKMDCFWGFITLRCLMGERRVLCQMFSNFA